MGDVVHFPAEAARTRASTYRDEPAQVIDFPMTPMKRQEKEAKANLPVPLGEPRCGR